MRHTPEEDLAPRSQTRWEGRRPPPAPPLAWRNSPWLGARGVNTRLG